MRVFVSEFLVGGASSRSAVPASMRREGRLMLHAVCDDIATLPGFSVVTTIGTHLPFSSKVEVVEVIEVDGPAHEAAVFQRLIAEVDAVLVIAPETDGILAERCRSVRAAGVSSWNCSPDAIDLCSDKLRLAEYLCAHGIPTIPTKLVDPSSPPDDLSRPAVLKPRDGAGSCLTFLVENHCDWDNAAQSFRDAQAAEKCLCQPFVPGRALSVGVNCSLDGLRIECLPVGEQFLSCDRRFRYLGGTIPADISAAARSAIHELVYATCRTIDGLAGYIGLDLLLTNDGEPLIVEINPRLTTSYIGYRQLFNDKLPMTWLAPDNTTPSSWKSGPVEFTMSSLAEDESRTES